MLAPYLGSFVGGKSAWVRSYLQASKFSAFPRRERATVGSKAARRTRKLPRDRGYGNCERCGVGVAAGCADRCSSSEAEMYSYNTQGIAQVSALGSSEASAPQRFKFNIMGDSNGGSATVRSRGGVLLGRVRFRRFHCNIIIIGAHTNTGAKQEHKT